MAIDVGCDYLNEITKGVIIAFHEIIKNLMWFPFESDYIIIGDSCRIFWILIEYAFIISSLFI